MKLCLWSTFFLKNLLNQIESILILFFGIKPFCVNEKNRSACEGEGSEGEDDYRTIIVYKISIMHTASRLLCA